MTSRSSRRTAGSTATRDLEGESGPCLCTLALIAAFLPPGARGPFRDLYVGASSDTSPFQLPPNLRTLAERSGAQPWRSRRASLLPLSLLAKQAKQAGVRQGRPRPARFPQLGLRVCSRPARSAPRPQPVVALVYAMPPASRFILVPSSPVIARVHAQTANAKGKRKTWNYAERGQVSRRQRLVCVTNTPTYRPQVDYDKHVAERAEMGVVPKPLDPKQCAELCKLLQDPPKGELFCTPRVMPCLPPSLSPS